MEFYSLPDMSLFMVSSGSGASRVLRNASLLCFPDMTATACPSGLSDQPDPEIDRDGGLHWLKTLAISLLAAQELRASDGLQSATDWPASWKLLADEGSGSQVRNPSQIENTGRLIVL